MSKLHGLRVAVLATDGVEEEELMEPARVLREAGCAVSVVSPKGGTIQSLKHDVALRSRIPVDVTIDDTKAEEWDALVLPGGTLNPDRLRVNEAVVRFIRDIAAADKPIAAICHGPWPLIDADCVRGKRVTSWPSLRADLTNAGGVWVDEACVVDGKLITSRNPRDLVPFGAAMLRVFAE